jgi:uncharacterized membrane protein
MESDTGRIEAFSDGVYAIAITLLVLDIKVPRADQLGSDGLLSALIDQWPNYLAFIASFLFILVMWINHHRLFTVIQRTDNNLLLFNGLLLLGVTLVPFPTALVAEYLEHEERLIAILVYNGWFFVIAIFFNLLWRYASYKNRLFNEKTDPALVRHISRQYSVGPAAYLLVLLIAFVSPWLSLALNVALAVFFALPNKAIRELTDEAE